MWNEPDDRRRGRERTLDGEIIPPGRPDPRGRRNDRIRVGHYVYVKRPGPLAFILGFLALAAIITLSIAVFLGFFFLILPLLVGATAAFLLLALIGAVLRR